MHRSSRVARDAPIIDAYSVPEQKLSLLKKNLQNFRDQIINIGIEDISINNVDSILRQNDLEVSKFTSSYFIALNK